MGFQTELSFHKAFISVPVSAYVEMEKPHRRSFRALAPPFSPSTPVTGLSAELVLAGEKSVSGKIVLCDGLPAVWQILALQDEGAAGVLYAQDANLHNMPVNPIWGSPTEKTEHLLPKIPVASVTRPDGEVLRAAVLAGRVVLRMETEVDTGWRTVPLLQADLKVPRSDKFLIFSGHIDSWDYGAMDNGAANATMLECARLLSGEREGLLRGLRLLFWAGHSQGKFFGSTWYADNHFEELCEHCVGHVYVDSTGGMDAVIVNEAPVMPQTKGLAASVITKQTGCEFLGKRIGHFADQSFYGVGLTSIFGTFSEQDQEKNRDVLSFREGETVRAGGLGWWWHTEHDTMDKIDKDFLVRDTRIYIAVLWRLLASPLLPYDFRAAVAEMEQTVEGLANNLGERFDLSPLLSRLSALHRAVDAFHEKAEAVKEAGPRAEAINATMMRLSQHIVRVAFHGENCFDFDLSGEMFPIPSLTDGKQLAEAPLGSHRYHMLQTQLRRGVNRVMYLLKEALKVLESDQ
jgi:hypothetical protein